MEHVAARIVELAEGREASNASDALRYFSTLRCCRHDILTPAAGGCRIASASALA